MKTIANILIVAMIMFCFAYLFLEAWDATEFSNQAYRANKQVERGHP